MNLYHQYTSTLKTADIPSKTLVPWKMGSLKQEYIFVVNNFKKKHFNAYFKHV